MDTLSSSDSEAPEAADELPSSQAVREQLGPLLQQKQRLKKEAAAAASALRASSAAVAARRKELRAAVVAQVGAGAATRDGCWGCCRRATRRLAATLSSGGGLQRQQQVALPRLLASLIPCHLTTPAPLPQSEVVAATLSSAGGELLQLMPRANSLGAAGSSAGSAQALLGFDAIICDEAAQVGAATYVVIDVDS